MLCLFQHLHVPPPSNPGICLNPTWCAVKSAYPLHTNATYGNLLWDAHFGETMPIMLVLWYMMPRFNLILVMVAATERFQSQQPVRDIIFWEAIASIQPLFPILYVHLIAVVKWYFKQGKKSLSYWWQRMTICRCILSDAPTSDVRLRWFLVFVTRFVLAFCLAENYHQSIVENG